MALLSTIIVAFCCLALCLGEPDFGEVPGGFLTPAEFNATVEEMPDVNEVDPTLNEGRFEGDIVLNKEDKERLAQEARSVNGLRSAGQDDSRKWANQQLPYVIDSAFTAEERAAIAVAMRKFHTKTCLRFVPHTEEEDYVAIRLGNENSSGVGRTGGRQHVTLMRGVYSGIVAHELMHALGFWHEHSRSDRDDFITINWHNIVSGMEHNFMKHEANSMSNFGLGYDLGSIMHFGTKAFTNNMIRDTIEVIGGGLIGQRIDLSELDVKKINMLYECPSSINAVGNE